MHIDSGPSYKEETQSPENSWLLTTKEGSLSAAQKTGPPRTFYNIITSLETEDPEEDSGMFYYFDL